MNFPGGYDTVNFKSEFHPGTYSSLTNVIECRNEKGESWETAKLENYSVRISNYGTTAKYGSLARYLNGSNCQLITPDSASKAIEKLSEALQIDFGEAKITRLDFALDLLMNHNPKDYFHFLGEMPRLEKNRKKGSLYYSNNQEVFTIYDKGAQIAKEKIEAPSEWYGRNVMRTEIRLKSPNRLMKRPRDRPIIGFDLSSENFFTEVWKHSHKRFNSIHKLLTPVLSMDNITKPDDFFILLEAWAIDQIGPEKVYEMIATLKARKALSHPKYYDRIRSKVKQRTGQIKYSDPSPLLDEIIQKMGSVL